MVFDPMLRTLGGRVGLGRVGKITAVDIRYRMDGEKLSYLGGVSLGVHPVGVDVN